MCCVCPHRLLLRLLEGGTVTVTDKLSALIDVS